MLVPVAAPAQAVEVDCYAHMNASSRYPDARGRAEYESDADGRRFGIHVAGIAKLAGRRLVVRVHGDVVGRMRVSHDGDAHLHRHSGVPAMDSGDRIRVRTRSGTLVSSGVLRSLHRYAM